MAQDKMTAKDWRERADDARRVAAGLRDPLSKAEFLRMAETYERLAERAEKSEKRA